MKKLIFSFVFLVIAGFVAQTYPLHAATSPSVAAVLGAEETEYLARTLGVLKIVLEDMRGLIASVPAPIPNSAELSSNLEAISGKLTLINATIESQALAYAKRDGEAESAALSRPILAPTTFIKKSPPLFSKREAPVTEQTTTLISSVSQRNILLAASVLLVIALCLVFLWLRKMKEPKVATVAVREPQGPIVPMIREDSIQSIPPDY